jgi:hypothetical protein
MILDVDVHLKDGRRKNGTVLSRSMLTLDMDYGTPNIADGMGIKGNVPWKHPAKFWRDADD